VAAVCCYTLRGRCVCVFGVKCGDLCGSEDVVARGVDWHSDAESKLDWSCVLGRPNRKDTSGVIYLIKFPNGKKYIGITASSFEERKKSHLSHRKSSNLPVHQALNVFYGEEAWEVIDYGDDWDELVRKEIFYITKYQSYIENNGYNLTLGGDGGVGYKHTVEQKEKNSVAKKQYFSSEENRKKQSKLNLLAHRENPQLAQQHSAFQKKRFESFVEREKVSDGVKRYLSDRSNLEKHAVERGAKPFQVFLVSSNEYVGEWLIQRECARDLSLDVGKINGCLKGSRLSHKGYRFIYK
jgi:group I intron endonuclease